jgi:hypothetical protein
MRKLITFISLLIPGFGFAGTHVMQGDAFTSSAPFNAGMYFPSDNLKNANYVALSTDTVILASGTLAGITITLPSAASNQGQVLSIIKVSQSSYTVTIAANGTDTIEGTGTIKLNAFGQKATIKSIGSVNNLGTWVGWGDGIQRTPPYVAAVPAGVAASAWYGSSVAVITSVYTNVPINVSTMVYRIGATASGNCDIGIYDSNGNLLWSRGSFVCPAQASPNVQTFPMVNLPSGYYYLAFTADNTTLTIQKQSANLMGGAASYVNTFPLPSTINISTGTTNSPLSIGLRVNGGDQF